MTGAEAGEDEADSSLVDLSLDGVTRHPTTREERLRSIRPFTEDQLLALHPVLLLDQDEDMVTRFLQECLQAQEAEFHQQLSSLREWKNSESRTRISCRQKVSQGKILENQYWSLSAQSVRGKGRCADGRLVEVKHGFSQAHANPDVLTRIRDCYQPLKEQIAVDAADHFFQRQYHEQQVEILVRSAILSQAASLTNGRSPDQEQQERQRLRNLISTLFAFIRCEQEHKSEHFVSLTTWLYQLARLLLSSAACRHEDRLFLLHHVLRCCGGISRWAVGLVQCPSPLDTEDEEEAVANMNYCLHMMSTVLSPVRCRDNFLGILPPPPPGDADGSSNTRAKSPSNSSASPSPPVADESDQAKVPQPQPGTGSAVAKEAGDEAWLLVDAETEESEEVFANRVNLTETDLVMVMQQVPLVSLMKFITEGSARLPPDSCTFGQVTQVSMSKVLAVASRVVRILRQGMAMFNCKQCQAVTDHLASLMRVVVQSVTKYWTACQQEVSRRSACPADPGDQDRAMVLRLQVEYDHFVLRTVSAILGSTRSGVWKYLSVLPFTGVTDSAMWKVLYLCYSSSSSGGEESDGDCHFLNDIYVTEVIWKCRFENADLRNRFHGRVDQLSPSERLALLDSLANMAKSRDKGCELITAVTNEMLELAFLRPGAEEEVSKRCTRVFADLARQHPAFLSSLLHRVRVSGTRNESLIEALSEVPCEQWRPTRPDLDLLLDWLLGTSINHFSNRLSRVLLTKVNWFSDARARSYKQLHVRIQDHRRVALQLYAAARMHVFVEGSASDPFSCPVFTGFDGKATLALAQSHQPHLFIQWCWRLLLSLKLHLFEQPAFLSSCSSSRATSPFASDEDPKLLVDGFDVLPNLLTDNELIPLSKGLAEQNPFAAYIALSMTESGHRTECLDQNLEYLMHLMAGKNFVQSLIILSWFVPLNIESADTLTRSKRFVGGMNALMVQEGNDLLDRLLGMVKQQLSHHRQHKQQLLSFWLDLLHEVAVVVVRSWSSGASWFLASSRGLQQVVYLLDTLILVTSEDDGLHQHLITWLLLRTYDEAFAKQLSSGGSALLSWIPSLIPGLGRERGKRCDWLTSVHLMQQKLPDRTTYLSWALIKGDMVKMEEILAEVMAEISSFLDTDRTQSEVPIDAIMKSVCHKHNKSPIPGALIPVNAWARLILDTPVPHPLMPYLFFNLFKCFFASTQSSGSLGYRFLPEATTRDLKLRMGHMVDYHHRQWTLLTSPAASLAPMASDPPDPDLIERHSNCTKWFRAMPVWMEEAHLHDPFVDLSQYPGSVCTDLLKLVMEGASEVVLSSYMEHAPTCQQEERLIKLWIDVKEYDPDLHPLVLDFSLVRDGLFEEAAKVPVPDPGRQQHKLKHMRLPMRHEVTGSGGATISLIQHNIANVVEEGLRFSRQLNEFSQLTHQLTQLLPQKFRTVRREVTLAGSCDKAAGYNSIDTCTGPAAVCLSFEESAENPQVAKELEQNAMELNKVLLQLLSAPSEAVVTTILIIEGYVSAYRGSADPRDRHSVTHMLHFMLTLLTDRSAILFPATRHLFRLLMDSLTMEDEEERDRNSEWILRTAIAQPHLVEFFAPLLVPARCSCQSFLLMYSLITDHVAALPPPVLFVLLSKFDVAAFLSMFRTRVKELTCLMKLIDAGIARLDKSPSDDRLMILGLYRKHAQYMAKLGGVKN